MKIKGNYVLKGISYGIFITFTKQNRLIVFFNRSLIVFHFYNDNMYTFYFVPKYFTKLLPSDRKKVVSFHFNNRHFSSKIHLK